MMKRSEMVKVIEEAMNSGFHNMGAISSKYIAETILTKILEAGMVPPIIEFEMGGTKIRDNGWEPENDK